METDSPYLAPHPLRGTQNVPGNVPLVVEEIARIKEKDTSEIATATFNNGCRLFGVKYED